MLSEDRCWLLSVNIDLSSIDLCLVFGPPSVDFCTDKTDLESKADVVSETLGGGRITWKAVRAVSLRRLSPRRRCPG